MLRVLIFISILLLTACTHNNEQRGYIVLGDQESHKIWVYLCGLTRQWDTPEEINNRKILAHIANREHIKIIAIKPFARCSQFDDKLCWPHDSKDQVKDTYTKITNMIPNMNIYGFIGFSNGAFFLNKAGQEIGLNKPIISIGGAGYFDPENSINTEIYLIVGKQDHYHYENAILFHEQAKKHGKNSVKLITHDGSHVIPENIVKQVIYDLDKSAEVSNE